MTREKHHALDKVTAYMNSQLLGDHAQDLCKLKSDQIPTLLMELLGIVSC